MISIRKIERIAMGFILVIFLFAMFSAIFVPTARAASSYVEIIDYAFQPSNLQITAGDTVIWINNGSALHSATSTTAIFNSGAMSNGEIFSYTFSTPGTFAYYCTYHPYMTGTIEVSVIPEFSQGAILFIVLIVIALVVLMGRRTREG